MKKVTVNLKPVYDQILVDLDHLQTADQANAMVKAAIKGLQEARDAIDGIGCGGMSIVVTFN